VSDEHTNTPCNRQWFRQAENVTQSIEVGVNGGNARDDISKSNQRLIITNQQEIPT